MLVYFISQCTAKKLAVVPSGQDERGKRAKKKGNGERWTISFAVF
jgi:hypothetical protein